MIGYDLERYTPVYIRSHSCHCMSEQKPSHEVKGILRRAPRQDCVKAQIWGIKSNNFCSIECPKTVAFIILKWQKFRTAKTLPRAVRPAKLNNRGRRALVKEVTKNPMFTPLWRWENHPEGQTSMQHSIRHLCQAFMVEWADGSHSSVKGT